MRKRSALRLYIRPFLAGKTVSEVDAGLIQEYRVHRLSAPPDPTILRGPRGVKIARQRRTFKLPSRSTLDKEIIVIRQVLKTANRKRWIAAVPDLSAPYKSSRKVSHRAWFSPEDYKRFYTATRERAGNPLKERWRHECEQFHDWVLFMANTGLRPDEASNLQYRDVSIILDDATNERILQIEVRGKRGVGYCKSMPGAVQPFRWAAPCGAEDPFLGNRRKMPLKRTNPVDSIETGLRQASDPGHLPLRSAWRSPMSLRRPSVHAQALMQID